MNFQELRLSALQLSHSILGSGSSNTVNLFALADDIVNYVSGRRRGGVTASLDDYKRRLLEITFEQFFQNCSVNNPIVGVTTPTPREYQLEIARKLSESPVLLVNAARQSGITTVLQLIALHTALYKSNQTISVFTQKNAWVRDFMERLWEVYDRLEIPKPGVVSRSSELGVFSNGSSITCKSAASARSSCGTKNTLAIVDNAGYISDSVFAEIVADLTVNSSRTVYATTGVPYNGTLANMFRSGKFNSVRVDYTQLSWEISPTYYADPEKFAIEFECKLPN